MLMILELRHFNTPLLRFSVQTNISEPEPEILRVTETDQRLFPLDLALSSKGLFRWLRQRTIPQKPQQCARASLQTRFEHQPPDEHHPGTLLPCVYDDLMGTARRVLTERHWEALRHLRLYPFMERDDGSSASVFLSVRFVRRNRFWITFQKRKNDCFSQTFWIALHFARERLVLILLAAKNDQAPLTP